MSTKLLTHGTLVTWDSATSSVSVLRDSHLLISGDTITHISNDLSSIPHDNDTEIFDCSDKIICPGFVDTHRHLWQTAWRSLGPNVTLAEYMFKYSAFGPAKDAYTSDDIYISTLAGCADALSTGVTTILDHSHNNWRKDVMQASFRGAADSGARVWWCYDPVAVESEGWGWDEQAAVLNSLSQGLRAGNADTLVRLGFAFDTISQGNQERIQQARNLVESLSLEVLTVHLLGGPWPVGGNSPALADKHGFLDLNVPMVFSHGGFLNDEEMQLLRSKNHYLSITPESEMHYGHGQVTSRNIQDHASLGVDTAWPFSGDMLTQARLWLQSNRLDRYERVLGQQGQGKIPRSSPMTAEQAFLLATRQGGLALRRDDIGVLQVGAKADIVIFDSDSPNMAGWSDPVAAVVLHANVGDIEGVLVGGQWKKKEGKLVSKFGGKSWKELRQEFVETAKKVQDAAREEVTFPDNFMGQDFGEVEKVVL